MAEQATTGASAPAKRGTRPPAEIEADLVATRERLVGTIAEIEDYVSPKNIAGRGKRKLRSIYTDDANNVRWDRVAMTAGALVASVVALRLTSKTVRWALAADDRHQAQVVYLPVPRAQVGQFTAAIGA